MIMIKSKKGENMTVFSTLRSADGKRHCDKPSHWLGEMEAGKR